MFTLVAFYEDVDLAGALGNIAAEPDAHIFTSGDDLRVPILNNLVAIAAGIGSGGSGYARLDAPSLLDLTRLYIAPINGNADAAAEPNDPPAIIDLRRNPIALAVDEAIQALSDSNTTAAEQQWVLLWLADGPIAPAEGGDMTTVRATSATALTADTWSRVAPTFADVLPVGRYQIVGFRAVAAGLVAARFVFKGGEGGNWRPGVIGCDTDDSLDSPLFRHGQFGVFGEFHSTTPPDIECLSISADAAQEFYLDLVRVG